MDQSSTKIVVHAERQFITAELARRWLKLNIDINRPLNQDRINQWARTMKAGKWHENGDTIGFAEDGSLINGQHRLHACVQCGVGFWCLVAYGIKKEAFITIDRGQPRTRGQVLRIDSGLPDANVVAATLVWLFRFRDGIVMTRGSATDIEIADLLLEHPGIKDSISAARRVLHNFKAGTISVVAFCHYVFTRQDATLAELFFDSLARGASLREVDPVYQLRKRLISSATSGRKIESYYTIALYFKAWLAEREQRPISSLQWQTSENFPNIGPIGTAKLRPEDVKKAAEASRTARKMNKKRHAGPAVVVKDDMKPATPSRLDALLSKHHGLDGRK